MTPSVEIRVLDDLREDVSDEDKKKSPLRFNTMTPSDFLIPPDYSIRQTVSAIYALAKGRRVSKLTIICHGVGMLVHGDARGDTGEPVHFPGATQSTMPSTVCRVYGGYGLHLGKEDMDLTNVSTFGQLRGCFTDTGLIQVFGCAAADTGPDTATLSGDGPKLMRALASETGASVRAPILLQKVGVQMGIAAGFDPVGPTILFTATGQKLETGGN